MAPPLMPKATAVWLVDNTTLTFEQIAAFCELHLLEVSAIADGEVAPGMQGLDPIVSGQLTVEEIARCTADPHATCAHRSGHGASETPPHPSQSGDWLGKWGCEPYQQ